MAAKMGNPNAKTTSSVGLESTSSSKVIANEKTSVMINNHFDANKAIFEEYSLAKIPLRSAGDKGAPAIFTRILSGYFDLA